jgi:hypothetical protein
MRVVTLGTLWRPLFSIIRLQDLSAPVTHLDQGNTLPLALDGAPENDRYHTMSISFEFTDLWLNANPGWLMIWAKELPNIPLYLGLRQFSNQTGWL